MTPEMIDKLNALITKIEKTRDDSAGVSAAELIPQRPICEDSLTNELVFSMLLWESSFDHALKAVERIHEELVDLNELRVCTPDELASILGVRMPRSSERASRLIRVLNEIYSRENTLFLQSLSEKTKREVQDYLESIDGLPSFAISRVILLALNWHAFPLDERLAKLLAAKDIVTQSSSLGQQGAELERGVRASDALRTYTHIEHWAHSQRSTSRARNSTGRKSTKGASS